MTHRNNQNLAFTCIYPVMADPRASESMRVSWSGGNQKQKLVQQKDGSYETSAHSHLHSSDRFALDPWTTLSSWTSTSPLLIGTGTTVSSPSSTSVLIA